MPLPTYNESLEEALAIVPAIVDHEVVEIENASERVLAKEIVADRDLPPYNRCQMDGYAVVASEITNGTSMIVMDRVAAGSNAAIEMNPNTCVAIATGAPVPVQFDAVVQHELTDRGDLSGGKVTFHVDEVKVGKAIHPQGADASSGTTLVSKGTVLRAHQLGIAATVGKTEVYVVRKPRVIILTSGDEVVPFHEMPEPHQIRNGNGTMVASLFELFGCEIVAKMHLKDDVKSTNYAVSDALQSCDLLVTVGGISAGDRDFFPKAFETSSVDFAVHGAAIQPGKPVMVGKSDNTMVLGLPGNPVSALVCSHLFGLPITRTMLGMQSLLSWVKLPLAVSVVPNKYRNVFRPCNIVDGKIVIPTWQGSGDLSHTSQAVGLAQLPMNEKEIPAGELVPFFHFLQ